MQKFSFLSKIALRSPLKKTETNITSKKIKNLILDSQMQEALFLASPGFLSAIENEGELSEKMLNTLYKYYARLSNRCTPFGLFASISTIKVANETKIDLHNAIFKKSVRYDMHFLGMLTEKINQEKSIRECLKYYPNNSIYRILDNFRYVEFYYEKEKRFHRIAEVEFNEHLQKIIETSKKGKTISEISNQLTGPNILLEDANHFLHSLIDAQFLVSELDLILTGEDNLEYLISILAENRFNFPEGIEIKSQLIFLKNGLKDLEREKNTSPESYRQLFKDIQNHNQNSNLSISKLFQVDTFNYLKNNTLEKNILKKLRKGIRALKMLSTSRENYKLNNFKQKFSNRYEQKMMPLCQVLDPDSGIGYTNIEGAKSPLLNNLTLIKRDKENEKIDLNPKKEFLLKKLISAYRNNKSAIELIDAELDSMEEDNTLLPDSFSVFFSVFTEGGDEKVFLKSASGPSANNLIGRFGHLHEDLLDISDKISVHEQKNHPDKIIAEIIHLPEARTGNILHRKFQRHYEIPYLAKSSLNEKNQIHINDLYVTVKNETVILYSKTLKKEIIPRLGNAHNYSYKALPIYNFLGDIQGQKAMGLGFDWGNVALSFPFLPRVSYKGVVLSKAQWNFQKEDLKDLFANKRDVAKRVRSFAKTYELPDVLLFVEGDNDVIINFKNDLSCSVFYSLLKNKNRVVLQEFLMEKPEITKGYANEFIAFATTETPAKSNILNSQLSEEKDSFSVGSHWVYFKFYCGASTAEDVLKLAITPFIEELREAKILDKWFFIRYHDKDGHHLRFRVKVYDTQNISRVTTAMKTYLSYFTEPKIIWKVQMDTYQQETERYGHSVINETESAFQNDSECTLAFLDMIEGDEGEKIRWLFSLLSIDAYLNDFALTEKEKLQLLREAKDGFGSEFNKDKFVNKKVNALYREHEKDIERMMKISSEKNPFYPILGLIKKRSAKNRKVISKIKEAMENEKGSTDSSQVFISHIHMICNRLFLTKQREHEAVVYDLLYQYYRRNTFR